MSSSTSTTSRAIFQTPKRPAHPKTMQPPETPDCFANVSLETPTSVKQRSFNTSKDRNVETNNLKVAVRVRPLNTRELNTFAVTNVVAVKNKDLTIRAVPAGSANISTDHVFQYDHVFWSCDESNLNYASQEDVYWAMGKPLLTSAFKGYNACLLAYGQTGSGKSYSMMGEHVNDTVDVDSIDSGIIPRFCKELFARIATLSANRKASVDVSYFEIYNEKIHDLLAAPSSYNNRKTALKVREHPSSGPYVVDLSVHPVKSYNELRSWIRIGNKHRATAATIMNENSSRSHSIFSIDLCLLDNDSEGDPGRRSKVSLVDLAGSERLGSTNGSSEERLRQGVSINRSLLTLGKVISALADQKKGTQFVPYRDSVLTWLLKESLGGNSLTSMLATITPASSHVDETLSTLRYACQARSIVNRARVNEDPHDRLIRELRAEVERLRALKKDQERLSLTPISVPAEDHRTEELSDLRNRLLETENQLRVAEESWEKRFTETKRQQLQELAEAEEQKEELKSHIRIMNMLDTDVSVSPYKSNFLEELADILNVTATSKTSIGVSLFKNSNMDNFIDDFKNWCLSDGLLVNFTFKRLSNKILIVNLDDDSEAVCSSDFIEDKEQFCTAHDFIKSLKWTKPIKTIKSVCKRLNKSEICTCFEQMYGLVSTLQPNTVDDERLRLSYAKVLKALQSFETSLQKSVSQSPLAQKSVTFNL